MFRHICALWNQFTKQELFEINFQMSLKQNKRTTRSSKKNLLFEEEVMSNCSSIKKADKSPIPSYSLKSSKLKGKGLTTFRKKREIGTPGLARREYLKGLFKSRMKIVTGKCIFVDKCVLIPNLYWLDLTVQHIKSVIYQFTLNVQLLMVWS